MNIPESLYPFSRNYLEIDGHRLHYLDEGEGRPVVMVHGNPSWSFYYRKLVLCLRDQYRTIVPDHIGCGLSDKPGDDAYEYTLASRVSDLERLLAQLGVEEKVTLILHDWGGMIGMAWAVRNIAAVERIVLLNTAAFHLPESKALPRSLGLVRNTAAGAWLVQRFNAFSRGAARFGVQHKMPPEVRQAYCAPYDTPANRVATLRFVQDIPLAPGDAAYELVSEVEAALPQFAHLPVMICWGMKDFVFDRHFLARWLQLWPQAEVHRFADAGHYVLEDAADEICRLAAGFLSGQGDRGGQHDHA